MLRVEARAICPHFIVGRPPSDSSTWHPGDLRTATATRHATTRSLFVSLRGVGCRQIERGLIAAPEQGALFVGPFQDVAHRLRASRQPSPREPIGKVRVAEVAQKVVGNLLRDQLDSFVVALHPCFGSGSVALQPSVVVPGHGTGRNSRKSSPLIFFGNLMPARRSDQSFRQFMGYISLR